MVGGAVRGLETCSAHSMTLLFYRALFDFHRGELVAAPFFTSAALLGYPRCLRPGQPHLSPPATTHIILYPCRSPHGGRLKDPMTWLHAHGPCACSRQGPSISAQGVRKWEGQRSRRSATRATAAPLCRTQKPLRHDSRTAASAVQASFFCLDAFATIAMMT